MIAIIDYKAGNVASVKNAVNNLGCEAEITADPKTILAADGVIFPGQGRAGSAIKELKKTGLEKTFSKIKRPFLGICLGMQLLAEYSEEDETSALGFLGGGCRRFPANLKVPHVGWNKVEIVKKSPLFEGIKSGEYFYFVHSYYFDATSDAEIVATTSYGFDFCSVAKKKNLFAIQFHPEKSGKAGKQLLSNFIKLCL